jgi:hypothetical protein
MERLYRGSQQLRLAAQQVRHAGRHQRVCHMHQLRCTPRKPLQPLLQRTLHLVRGAGVQGSTAYRS